MRISSNALMIAAAALLAAGAAQAKTLPAKPAKVAQPGCDRACLDGFVDRYLDAMIARDPASLPWAGVVRYSENNVPMAIGDGVWATITARSKAPLRAADPKAGEVAWLGEIEEHGQPAFMALRLKVVGRKIAEAEAVVRRKGGPPEYGDPQAWAHDPSFAKAAPANRAALTATVDGYFDGIEGRVGARLQIDPKCARLDNGVDTTSGPAAEGDVEGCAAQIRAGVFKPIRQARARRYPVVDEARGVVVATGFLDLPSRAARPAGDKTAFATDYPYSIGFMAAFKIRDGKVYRIDSVSGALPYLMPSPYSASR